MAPGRPRTQGRGAAPTFAGAKGQHGRLALTRRAPRHHQHLVEAGGLQLREPQLVLAARDPHRVPAAHHASAVIQLHGTGRESSASAGKGADPNGMLQSLKAFTHPEPLGKTAHVFLY